MSASKSMAPELPNPFTPLAFLPPTVSNQIEVSRSLYAVTLGIYIWDIAINLPNDRLLLFKQKIGLPTIAYYISRVFALCYYLTSFVFQVGRVENCQALQLAIGATWTTSQVFTTFLFFMRVRAVYHRNKLAQAIFLLLWISVAGSAITIPVGIKAAHLGLTKQCIITSVPLYTQASAWISLTNDSAVFIAITYRILAYNLTEETFKGRVRIFFGGRPILQLSRSLLLSGQHYYLIALCGNLLLLVLVILPGVPPVYRGMCTVPVSAVTNLMACIVFRKIKFGHISQDGNTFTTFNGASKDKTANDISVHCYQDRFPKNDAGCYTLRSGSSCTETIQVDVIKSMETDYPLQDIKTQVDNQV